MTRAIPITLVLSCGFLVAGSVWAATGFSGLAAGEQSLLAPAKALWAQLDAPARQELQANARDWLARSPTERGVQRARLRAWDSLPIAERAARRSAFAAWRRLDAAERVQLRQRAIDFAALPPDQQQALRTAFDQQPFDQQRNWTLGPTLGAQLASLAPMFAYVPESERGGVFALMRQLDASARADLVLLAPRLDNGGRDRLRRALQAAPPAARGALIRRALDRP
jgi:hypothetical protein